MDQELPIGVFQSFRGIKKKTSIQQADAHPRISSFYLRAIFKEVSMRGWERALWGVVTITLAIGVTHCVYTERTKIAPPIVAAFKGESRVDQYLLDHQPQTVAVLPFLNRTDKKEAFDIVRKSFHGHFSKLNYTPMPLFKVDDSLRQAGLDTPEKVGQTSAEKLRGVLRVDAIIRGEVTHYERIYVGVYSQVAVGQRRFPQACGWNIYYSGGVDFNCCHNCPEHARNRASPFIG
jgi:hypothetical protein